MLLETALLLEIRSTKPTLKEQTAQMYTQYVLQEADRQVIDPWVFHGIIKIESEWTSKAFRKEGDGSCSIGLGQINVKCDDKKRIAELSDPKKNIEAMGSFLGRIKNTCRKKCDGLGWLVRYNPGNHQYVGWVSGVVQRCHAAYEPTLRNVPTPVHPSWVWYREED